MYDARDVELAREILRQIHWIVYSVCAHRIDKLANTVQRIIHDVR